MPIPFQCPNCRYSAQAPDEMSGKEGKCPKCQTVILLGYAQPPEPPPVVIRKPPKAIAERRPGWLFRWGPTVLAVVSFAGIVFYFTSAFFRWIDILGAGTYLFASCLLTALIGLLLVVLRSLMSRKQPWPEEYRAKYTSRGWLAGMIALILICLATIHSANALVIALHYSCFAGAIYTGIEFIRTKVKWERIRWLEAIVIALSVGIGWFNDFYIRTWTKKAGEYDTFETVFEDQYRRFGSHLFYRKIEVRKPGSYLVWRSSEGPMTETNKPHGKWSWKWTNWDGDFLASENRDSGIDFFWYGEKVTEGEWHLRNK